MNVKSKDLSVRMEPEEYSRLVAAAELSGLAVANYARRAIKLVVSGHLDRERKSDAMRGFDCVFPESSYESFLDFMRDFVKAEVKRLMDLDKVKPRH